MRHRFLVVALTALASVFLASVAVAGGWAQVAVTDVPADPPAGEGTTIDLTVLQHGAAPVSWPSLTVIATDAITGTVVRTEAEATGPVGSYVATIAFPTPGQWTLTFESTDLDMQGSVDLSVAPAIVPAPAAVAAPAAEPDAMPLMLMLLAATGALAVGGMLLRMRNTSGRARASAGN